MSSGTKSLIKAVQNLEKRAQTRAVASKIDVLSGTFAPQRAFIEDPAKLKSLLCTRRSGKSMSAGLYLTKECLEHPGVTCLFVGLTRDSSKRIIWKDILKAIDRKFKIGARFNESALSVTFPNGSVIYVVGADSSDTEQEKLLGQRFWLVIIDEAGSFSIDLRQLVYAVLKPAVADYRGTICLIGTPSNLARGLYFDVTNGKEPGWSQHGWKTPDNPYMAKQWREEIESLTKNNPLIAETPFFRQNYLGLWVVDTSKRVYRYDPNKNWYDILPSYARGNYHYVLGIDLGFNDATAFVLAAFHDHDKTLYFVDAWKKSGMDITAVALRIKKFQQQYDIESMVVDGASRQAVEELRRRHGLPLILAEKQGKESVIEVMNGEFLQGRIKLSGMCGGLAEEYLGLIWKELPARRIEHPSCPNHETDAALYAWRYSYAYVSEAIPLKVDPGSEEFWRLEEQGMFDRALEEATRKKREMEGDPEPLESSEDWEPWLH